MKFEKVSFTQFASDITAVTSLENQNIKDIYKAIPLPRRATKGSAGYDFYIPFDVELAPGESTVIPSGIRVFMPSKVVLLLIPRSGLGVRYRMQLANTIGVIDSDYYYAANEGHIIITITNDSKEDKSLRISKGDRFVQGIFIPFLICEDDTSAENRTGGFGSTDQ